MIITGASGSGKTQLALNLLTRRELLGDFYNEILLFAPTAALDDTYKHLDHHSFDSFSAADLEGIIATRKAQIKKDGIAKVGRESRMLLILDDCIAERSFLESKEATKMFALLRHYLCSVIIMTQSYNQIPRRLRVNANSIAVFPGSRTKEDVITDEFCPSGWTKAQFRKALPSKKYDFLYINRHHSNHPRLNFGPILSPGMDE